MNNQNYNGYNQPPYNQSQQPYQQSQQPYNQYQQNNYQQTQPNQMYQQPQMQQTNKNSNNQTGHGANMIQAIKLFFTHYIDFKSKSTRSEWWWMKLWELIYLIIGTILLTVTGTSSVITTLATSGLKGAGFIGSLFSFGFVGILMFLINLAICIPFLALRTRRFNDMGLPFIASVGINVARVICFWLAKFTMFFGVLFSILMIASFILELMPSKNKPHNQPMNNNVPYNNDNPSQSNMNPQMNNGYQPTMNQQTNVNPQMNNNYQQPNMNIQQNQYQQPNGYQQPQNNQPYQQPQQPYNPYQR